MGDIGYSIRWELTLKSKGQGFYLMMGFIDVDHIASYSPNTAFGTRGNDGALWVMDNNYPRVRSAAEQRSLHEDWKFLTKIGDKFILKFDFKKMECSAMYNDQELGVIT